MSQHHIYDYIVIGSGISGIQSLQILSRQTKNIILLQSQNVIGGRIFTQHIVNLPGASQTQWIKNNHNQLKHVVVQKGATWIQQRHTYLKKICQQFGVSLREQNCQGCSIHLHKDTPLTNKQLMAHQKFGKPILQFLQIADALSQLYNKHVLTSNQNTQKANQMLSTYDSKIVTQYLKQNITTEQAKQIVQNLLQHTQSMSCDLNSMHQVLTKNARSNDLGILKQFLGQEYHQKSYLVNDGTTLIINKFLQSIQKNLQSTQNKFIKFNQQVLTINNTKPDICIITTLNHKQNESHTFLSKKIICTVPISISRTLTITNISRAKQFIIDNQSRTNCVKSFLILKKPFWRPHATGDCSFSQQYPINIAHDISPTDLSCGILVFFHSGKKYIQWQTKFKTQPNQFQSKRKYIIDTVTKLFKVDQATSQQYLSTSLFYTSTYMTNPNIKSGFQSCTSPGTFSTIVKWGDGLDALYRDQNNVYFVGTEYSQYFASYMEGAIRCARTKCHQIIGKPDQLLLEIQKQEQQSKN